MINDSTCLLMFNRHFVTLVLIYIPTANTSQGEKFLKMAVSLIFECKTWLYANYKHWYVVTDIWASVPLMLWYCDYHSQQVVHLVATETMVSNQDKNMKNDPSHNQKLSCEV